jgi:phage-related tail fiber protein
MEEGDDFWLFAVDTFGHFVVPNVNEFYKPAVANGCMKTVCFIICIMLDQKADVNMTIACKRPQAN